MIRDYLVSGQTPPSTKEPITTLAQSLHRAVHFYSMLQTETGHWSGDYGGPLFLLPGLIVVWYVMGQPALMWSAAETTLMKQYITVHQQTDGGWGTHSTCSMIQRSYGISLFLALTLLRLHFSYRSKSNRLRPCLGQL